MPMRHLTLLLLLRFRSLANVAILKLNYLLWPEYGILLLLLNLLRDRLNNGQIKVGEKAHGSLVLHVREISTRSG